MSGKVPAIEYLQLVQHLHYLGEMKSQVGDWQEDHTQSPEIKKSKKSSMLEPKLSPATTHARMHARAHMHQVQAEGMEMGVGLGDKRVNSSRAWAKGRECFELFALC